jgi:hypothetical protein
MTTYYHGYRDGQIDSINKLPYNDEMVPFSGDNAEVMYKIGYRAGWDLETF